MTRGSPKERHELSCPPPAFPWIDLDPDSAADSYLSFYYVSPLSALPVRDVNRVSGISESGTYLADCKSDPNLETQTFGLFSTCQSQTRQGIVRNRSPFLFFFGSRETDVGVERRIIGYYELGWYAHGGTHRGDYCLAAKGCHFVSKPVSFHVINSEAGTSFSNRNPRRVMCRVPASVSRLIVAILQRQQDATPLYIKEVHRLERMNAAQSGGLKYINFGRRESFSWGDLAHFRQLGTPSMAPRQKNKVASGRWFCSSCGRIALSSSRLKLCPLCGSSDPLSSAP